MAGLPCDTPRVSAEKKRVDRGRMEAAMEAAGYDRKNALARAVGVWPAQIKRWLDGDNAPAGPHLERLCAVLDVTPAHLFGESEPSTAESLLREASRVLGEPHARVLALVARLTKAEAERLVEHLDGWVTATIAARSPQVPFPVDEDRLKRERQEVGAARSAADAEVRRGTRRR